MSAWWTANISTNSCGSARRKAGADRLTGTFLRIERDADGTHVVYRDKASGERARA